MSRDSITLETAEERDFWLCAYIELLGDDGLTCDQAANFADAAVRAYRERLPGSQSVGGSSLDVDPYKLASALGWHGPAFGMIEEVARIKATVDAASAASDPGSQTPSGCPPRGGHERSVIVPCPGCRNDVLARVVNGRVDDPWCCDCLTEQEPDERTETDVAPEPLIRGSAAPGWRSVEWAGPCARGDSGDASKLQAELTALRERLVELVDGLQRRRSECESLANAPRPMPTASRARCNGKASAYGHAAEMLREALREDS